MKKVVIWCIVFLGIGIFLGRYFASLTAEKEIITTEEQIELAKWKEVEMLRAETAEDVYKKASDVISSLSSFGEGYSNGDLYLNYWGEIFSATGLKIYYKKKLVFDVTSGIVSDIGKVNVFRPGEWIVKLKAIDVRKEKAIKAINQIKEDFGSI